ncbi:hypothetical protein, partial [Enterobacter sichuanensis]
VFFYNRKGVLGAKAVTMCTLCDQFRTHVQTTGAVGKTTLNYFIKIAVKTFVVGFKYYFCIFPPCPCGWGPG